MLRRFSINFALISIALDFLFVFIALHFSVLLRPLLNNIPGIVFLPSPTYFPALLYFLFPIMWVIICMILSVYDGRKYLRVTDEIGILTLAVLIASVSSAGILYFSYRQVSRALFVTFIIFAYSFCLIWRGIMRLYFRSQKKIPDQIRRVLVVGAGPLGMRVYSQILETQNPNLLPVGFVDDEPKQLNAPASFLGNSENIREIIKKFSVSHVVIALPHSEYHQMGSMVQRLEDLPVQVWVALGFFDLALYKTNIEDFAGIPMLDLRASAIDDYQRMLKRAFDIFGGTLALMLAIPFMALSALAIIVEDGFPILFKQKRAGENGRIFEMLKFRTMLKNAEQLQGQVEKRDANGNLIHKTKEDWRVTKVGRILRRFSLDEMPQFINVIRGDMSLVGPRPELPSLVEKYKPWQRKRFAIPPGITGWWQVNGRSDKPMHLHTEDDLYYIQNYSIFLDIQILVKTAWVVLNGKGSY